MIGLLLKPYIFVFFVFLGSSFETVIDIQQDVLQGLRNGNAKEVASFFVANVSITAKNETGYYSKFQAEMVLADFFRANKPLEVKRVQRISGNTSNYYVIYQYKTASDSYRVFVRFVDSAGTHQISELRIE